MRRILLWLAVLLLGACMDAPTTAPPLATEAIREISDGEHGGSPHFYFLPPMVPQPSFSGVFDSELSPTVAVCEWSGSACGRTVVRFAMDAGNPLERIRVLPAAGRYAATWFTFPYHLRAGLYRLTTMVGTQVLGYADVMVVRRPSDLRYVDRTKYVGVVNGAILPIAFRIERGMPARVAVSPSAASIDVGTSQAFSAAVWDLHGNPIPCAQSVMWSSSNPAIAVVSSVGAATGVAAGTATISARCENAVGAAALTVSAKSITWVQQPSGTTLDLYDLSGLSGGDIFLSGDWGTILRYNGSVWTPMTSPVSWHLWRVWAAASDDAYIVGPNNVILHYDGTAWGTIPNITLSDGTAIWGTSGQDVFLGTWNGYTAHYDGIQWTIQSHITPHYIVDLWGASATDVYGVGDFGQILHYDGTSWAFSRPVGSGPALEAVFGLSESDVYAVGFNGTILHYDGTSWTQMASGTTANLHNVWAAASTDVYVVGDGGLILHYDGAAWSAMPSGTTVRLNGIWGSSASDVFIAGYGGIILHGTK